ncbi:hypothetical protein AKJ47_02980 [candidate division MSBL1 archaeon SCGC-AAA261G05]|uniref:Ribose-5-phosphate isomerase A n=1 Tax=candidate division MSBL1 archaeon SCGC-AAA261G05 TaxID=1698276 RepID=A0A133V976_9EURY|nr:hypothetical protein AKJ47_02980 [candidate division MSBL1 archaeon SCGC-AAA261G05]
MTHKDWKQKAAKKAAELIEKDMIVGLGSGSTVAEVIKILGDREIDATFVSSSSATQQLADEQGLSLTSLDGESSLDLTIDGADEVAPDFSLIKGGGGAHTREKIIASAASEVIIVVDKTKLVRELGEKRPVPVEVIPFAQGFISRQLEELGGGPQLRESSTGGPFITDNGNYILDVKFKSIKDPSELESDLNKIPGVVENGIFTNLAGQILVGHEEGCTTLDSREDFLDLISSD